MLKTKLLFAGIIVVTFMQGGCSSNTPPPSGFLRDYSRLEKVQDGWMRYISPKLASYNSFLIDPVEIRVKRDVLDDKKKAEIANYMHGALGKVMKSRNCQLAMQPRVGTARLRIAITDIQESKWYLNIHPATKITGAGRASASMEAEVVDSVTGEQLAASIRAGKGKQFELNPFSTVDDVKNLIDRWAESAGERLDEMRKAKK